MNVFSRTKCKLDTCKYIVISLSLWSDKKPHQTLVSASHKCYEEAIMIVWNLMSTCLDCALIY